MKIRQNTLAAEGLQELVFSICFCCHQWHKTWHPMVLLIWYYKKDLRSCSSSHRFSDLKTNLIFKKICWSIHATVNEKTVQGNLWGEGALINSITWNCALIYLYNCKITFFVPQNVRPAGRAGTLLEWLVAEGNTTPILSRAFYQSIELAIVKTCLQHD